MKPLNIVFAGTPAFGLPALEAIFASPHRLKAVYTQPDRPAGRGQKIQLSPIKQWAIDHTIAIEQPVNFKTPQSLERLSGFDFDVMIVIAYGIILPESVLKIPRFGCINVHASLLPKYRGAAPIQQAILKGENNSGVTIMQMNKGMDTGEILTHRTCAIHSDDTGGSLHDRLATLAIQPLIDSLNNIEHLLPTAQNHSLASYAPKIQKADAAIQWSQTAKNIDQHIRAYHPWPIAYTQAKDQILRIHKATMAPNIVKSIPGAILDINNKGIRIATLDEDIVIQALQFPGGKILDVAEWIHAQHHKKILYPGLILQ